MQNPFQQLPDAQRRDGMLSTRHLFEGGKIRSGDNLRAVGYGGYVTISADAAASTTTETAAASTSTHAFKCPATTNGSSASTIVAGTVNGVTATNLTPVISNSGTKYVYLDVTYTQDLSANNYVIGFSGSITCAIATGSSVPSDTSTHLYRQVATYVDGVKTVQAIESSMQVEARDDGNGTATTRAIWGRA